MPKRKCKFSDTYTTEWSYIKKGRNEHEAFCSVCDSYLSISHGGRSNICDHVQSNKHKSKLGAATTSRALPSFFITKNSRQEELICLAELTTAFKAVNHHHSFNSLDCTTKLNSILFPDSEIASKMSTARTKATALINVLSKHSMNIVTETLIKTNIFYGISTDSSNHKAAKLFPLLLHYFTEEEGMQIKLLKLTTLPNETSDTVTFFCVDTLKQNNISLKNLVAFGADNTNTNFGGRERRGINNIFHKLKGILNKEIEGIGCSAHILHNAVSTASDVLQIDIESIVLKIYKFFSIYTVRTERLKDFCENAEIEYNSILSHSRSRWLSLVPAIERILQLWEPLKDFFAAEENAPSAIVDFFNNPLAEVYVHFVLCQSSLIEKLIKRIEKKNLSIIEVVQYINEAINSLKERFMHKFIGHQTQVLYEQLKKKDFLSAQIKQFEKDQHKFFKTIIQYLEQWSKPLKKYEVFGWMLLKNIPTWEDVQKSILILHEMQITFSDGCFEEVSYLKSFIETETENWHSKDMNEKWKYFFSQTKEKERKSNLLKMVQFLYAIPGHNANVERVFSLITAQWSKERNSLNITTLESIMQCKFNYSMSCHEFYNYIKTQRNVIAETKKSAKYDLGKP